MNAASQLHIVLARIADERGHVRTTMAELIEATGLSERTIRRALGELVTSGLVLRRSKSGPDGGLLIRLEFRSQPGQNSGQNSGQNGRKRDVVTPGLGLEEAKAKTRLCEPIPAITPANDPAPVPLPSWWVCCIWYDDDGAMWAHGGDGFATYIPCRSQAEAEALAKEHVAMLHKDRSEPGIGRFPRVDVCRSLGAGKELHTSLGTLVHAP